MPDRIAACEREVRLLQVLKVCAAAGEKCPTNGALCELLGLDSVGASSGVMSRLERRGMISVERGQQCRVVTITETGQKTAGVVRIPHWRLRGGAQSQRPRKAALAGAAASAEDTPDKNRQRVDRDPCFLCGARGDVGCKHRMVTHG